jgi:hypothetical protein
MNLCVGCCVRETRKKYLLQPTTNIHYIVVAFLQQPTMPVNAVCETTMGNFTIELFTEQMPITAYNFVDLAKKGYYDGLVSFAATN